MRTVRNVTLYFLSFGIAAYAVFGYAVMPLGSLVHPDMKSGFVAHPIGVYFHVFAAAVTLALGPFQFSDRLRASRIQLHRLIGRAYLGVGVLVGGLSGLYLAAFAFGGPVAKTGFAMLAVSWLYTGLRAYLAIRRRAIDEHRKWVLRNFSLAFAAVMLRIYIPVPVLASVDFAVAYPIIAWACWTPNILVAEWMAHKSLKPMLPARSTKDGRD
jgi:uncharacterized membrane protein